MPGAAEVGRAAEPTASRSHPAHVSSLAQAGVGTRDPRSASRITWPGHGAVGRCLLVLPSRTAWSFLPRSPERPGGQVRHFEGSCSAVLDTPVTHALLMVNMEVDVLLDERGAAEPSSGTGSPSGAGVRRSAGVAAGVAVVYVVLAEYIDWLNEPLQNGASFWPAAGVTVAALLFVPTRHWWMVAGAVLLAESGTNLSHGLPLLPSVGWGVANTLEPLIGAGLVRRASPRAASGPLRRLLLFLACAAGVAPAIGAALGALVAVHATGAVWSEVWVRWTVGDALGVLVMAPPVLAWHRGSPVARSLAERGAVTALVLASAALVLRDGGPTWRALLPYLVLPALVWAAARFGMRGATLAALVTAHAANLALALDLGPFAAASDSHATTALQLALVITVGTTLVLAAMAADLTERDEVERLLGHQAAHDHLTGLPNRVLLHERLGQVLDRAAPGRAVAVLFLDLDRFKAVNDSLGHAWGDVLLVETAARLQAAGRPRDLVARLGGDEFVVVCADLDDPAEAGVVARRMLAAVCEPVSHDGRTVAVSTSIGIATVTAPGCTPEEVLRNADTAMYRAKTDGRSRIDFFDETLHDQAQLRLDLEVELRQALARGQLRLHYQPVRAAADLRPVAVEALLRWEHPVRGVLSPAAFLPWRRTPACWVRSGTGWSCRRWVTSRRAATPVWGSASTSRRCSCRRWRARTSRRWCSRPAGASASTRAG
jgi:diguanylate cyclase (GGDEF)-like protein